MAEIINEKQIAGFRASAVPALAGQLPVVPGQIKVRRVLKVTAAHYGMTLDELLARGRTRRSSPTTWATATTRRSCMACGPSKACLTPATSRRRPLSGRSPSGCK
jgi:hypothetical protein